MIIARVDRLPAAYRSTLTAASVLGRQFGLPLLEGVVPDAGLRESLRELQRLDLLRESRRWPQPEYRFKHVLIQEAVYRTIVGDERRRLHREAAEWLERRRVEGGEEALGILAHHWLAAEDESKAVDYLTRAGDKARQEYALSEAIEPLRRPPRLLKRRGESREVALVLFKLALALHASLRFAEANAAYQDAFDHWQPVEPVSADGGAADRRRASCRTTSTRPRRSPGPTSSSACSCSTASSRRGPSARSCRRSQSAGRSPTTGSATSSTCARA